MAALLKDAIKPNMIQTLENTPVLVHGGPFFKASISGFDNSCLGTPPLYFNALTVATITTASGLSPAFLHLISKNFSAPRSAPKPASVTAISASFKEWYSKP